MKTYVKKRRKIIIKVNKVNMFLIYLCFTFIQDYVKFILLRFNISSLLDFTFLFKIEYVIINR